MRKNIDSSKLRIITILSVILSITLAIVSYYGSFVPETYQRDAASMAAQGKGQDIVDLFFVVPILLLTLALMHKNNRTAYFIFSGTVFYILYSFFIYSFGVHFNNLFLMYCITLGISFFVFILMIIELNNMEVENWFSEKIPVRTIGIYFIIIAAMFYLLWLKDIVPAIINNTIPRDVREYHLLVNPVHVLDISFALPGLVITAVLLIKKQRIGIIFAPVFLVFTLILAIALIGMVIMLNLEGISEDVSVVIIFSILAIISSIILFKFLTCIKKDL